MNKLVLLITVVAYFIVSIFIGIIRSRGSTPESFVGERNKIGFFSFVSTVASIVIGGGMFFAVGQIGYEAGAVGYVIGIAYLIGFFILGATANKVRELVDSSAPTFYDFLDQKYKSKSRISVAFVFQIATFIVFFLILGAQFVAISVYAQHVMGTSRLFSVILVSVLIPMLTILIYSVVGGFPKDVATDVLQFVLILFGTILLCSKIIGEDVITKISSLPDEYFTGLGPPESGYGVIYVLGAIIFVTPSFFVRMDMWQRTLAARNDSVARWGFITAGIISLIAYFVFTTIGMFGKSKGVTSGPDVSIQAIEFFKFSWQHTAVAVAFLAAVMSSADTFLNIASSAFVRSLWPSKWEQGMSKNAEKSQKRYVMRRLRISTASMGMIAAIFAFLFPNIVDLFSGAFAVLLISCPAVFAALFASRLSERAALY
ncbi:MAG: hypothetical protein KJ935_06490, partial [Candidatus Omnitrophica bacterium]|nr:hypothetical protein [Candidatus Omnitrophota bacterium]